MTKHTWKHFHAKEQNFKIKTWQILQQKERNTRARKHQSTKQLQSLFQRGGFHMVKTLHNILSFIQLNNGNSYSIMAQLWSGFVATGHWALTVMLKWTWSQFSDLVAVVNLKCKAVADLDCDIVVMLDRDPRWLHGQERYIWEQGLVWLKEKHGWTGAWECVDVADIGDRATLTSLETRAVTWNPGT